MSAVYFMGLANNVICEALEVLHLSLNSLMHRNSFNHFKILRGFTPFFIIPPKTSDVLFLFSYKIKILRKPKRFPETLKF